jgi:hypothetical protein
VVVPRVSAVLECQARIVPEALVLDFAGLVPVECEAVFPSRPDMRMDKESNRSHP